MAMSDEIAYLIGAPTREIEATAIAQGMFTLREDGVRLAVAGITTLETLPTDFLTAYLAQHNAQFAIPQNDPESAYRPLLGDLLLERFNFAPAIVFYFLYTAGIVVFAVSPAFVSGRWTTALVSGAMLGFLCYATYDLTNQATLRGWSTIVTLVDIAWGSTLTAVAAALGYLGTNAALKVMDS